MCARLFSDPLLFLHYWAKNILDYLVRSDTFAGNKKIDRIVNEVGFLPVKNVWLVNIYGENK